MFFVGCNGSPGLLPQLPGHSALTNIDPLQSIESVFSIDANYRNSLVPPRPASPREQVRYANSSSYPKIKINHMPEH